MNTKIPNFRRCVIQNFPFIEEDFDALTDYQLLSKVVEYLNNVINQTNTNTDTVNEYTQKFIQLKTFVDEYFDNLDVQDEINQKLERMASDGTLALLLSSYVTPLLDEFQSEVNNQLNDQNAEIDAQNEEIDRIGALVTASNSGSPLVASSTSEMTDTTRIYVNTTDGKWYYYDGDSWEIGGTFQASTTSEVEELNKDIINSSSNNIRINYVPTFTADKRLDGSGNLYTEVGVSTSSFLPYDNCFGFRITIPTVTTNAYICYYDKDKTMLSTRYGLNSGVNNNNIVPTGTKFIRYCCKTDELTNVQASAQTYLNDRIAKLESNPNLYYEVNTRNQAITTNVSIGQTVTLTPTTSTNYRYIIMNCEEGDVFKIVGKGGNSFRLWAFIDSDNELLNKSENITAFSSNYCVAPKGSAKLILNFNVASLTDEQFNSIAINKLTGFNAKTMENGYNIAADSDFIGTYGFIDLSANAGETVDLTPTTTGGWEYVILPVKGISQLYISGRGGISPRLWAFIDDSNKLITKSESNLTYDGIVDVPYNANKVIVNYQTSYKEVLQIVGKPILSLMEERLDIDEYNLAKKYEHVLTSTDYGMCSAVRGLYVRNQLNHPLTDFKKPTDTMVHVSTFKIVSNNVYVTYFASNTSIVEDPRYQIARFVKAPLNNLSNKTYYDIISVGDTFDSKQVTAIYDTILEQVDDDTLYIMICLMLDGVYTRVYVPYTISTGSFGDMSYNYFKVGGTRMIWNTTNMRTLLDNAGIPHNKISDSVYGQDIGIMQKFTPHEENDITYLYGGTYIGTFNCLIKTTDFITFTYVAQPTWAGNYWVENSVYVIGDKAFYYLRQQNEEQSGILSYYDINENRWATPVYVPDAQSRGDFIKIGGSLYLFHNKNSRYTMSVLKVNPEYLNRSYDYSECCVDFMHYPYVDSYNGHYYMTYSQSRNHIYFQEIDLGSDNDTISNNMYNKIFN